MSAAETAPITIQPVAEPVKTQEESAAAALLEGPGPVVPAKDENAPLADEDKTTTTIKETEAKPASPKERKPFSVLNNLFHRKEKVTSPTTEHKDPIKDEAPVIEAPKEEPVVEQPVAIETPVTEAAPAEAAAVGEAESPKKKDGFLDKLKRLGGEKKDKPAGKKSKEPEEAKTEEVAPVAATEEAAPVPALVETPAIAPIEPAAPLAEVIPLPETAVTEAPAVTTESEAAKSVESPTSPVLDDKKKAKLGRRLSARIGNIFASPKKEKVNPLDKSPAEEKTVEESQAAEPAKVTEVANPEATKTDVPLVEAPKADLPKVEEPVVAVQAPTTEASTTEAKPLEPTAA